MEFQHPLVLFDGVCNFCNATVNFLIRQDKAARLRFLPLQSEFGQQLLEEYNLPKTHFDSFVFIKKGKAYISSSAGLKVIRELPWYWKWVQALWVIPKPIRDALYNFIARNRYRWFGRKDQCMIPTPELRNRFISYETKH